MSSSAKDIFGIVISSLLFPPLLALYLGVKKSFFIRRAVFAALGTIYGLTLKLGPNADGTRHFERAELYYHGMTLKQFFQELGQIFALDGTPANVYDPFTHVISYLTVGVLGSAFLFFPIIGLIFGWYFGGAVLLAIDRLRIKHINYIILFFLSLVLFLRGINEIQAVRMWTAMWMVVFSVLYWARTQNPSALFPFALAPFVHFAYFILCPIILAIWFFRRQRKGLVIAFFITAAISLPVNITGFGAIEDTALFETRSGYMVDSRSGLASVEARNNSIPSGAWYARFVRMGGIDYAFTVFCAVLILSGFYSKAKGWRADLISVGMGIMIFSNLVVFIPALAGRSTLIAGIFLLLGFLAARIHALEEITSCAKQPAVYKLGIHVSILVLSPVLLYSLSSNTEGVSYLMLSSPLVAVFFPDINMSIKELVNWLM